MSAHPLVLLGAVILLTLPAQGILGKPPSPDPIDGAVGFRVNGPASSGALSPGTGELTAPFKISNVSVEKALGGGSIFSGLTAAGIPGRPALPMQTVRVLLPPDAKAETVSAFIRNAVIREVAGEWDVLPAPPYCASGGKVVWPAGLRILDGRDVDVYSSDSFYPDSHMGDVLAGGWRRWKVVSVVVIPYRYNPVTRKLLFLESGELAVQYGREGATAAPGPAASAAREAWPAPERVRRNVVSGVINPEAAAAYDPGEVQPVPSGPGAALAIITTSSITNRSSKLAEFKSAKEALGFTVRIVTEGASADNSHYVAGSSCSQRADNVRGWLTNYYASLGIDYVLLIGNPHPSSFVSNVSVPMKMCFPRSSETTYKESPTDMYFAELTGNWDNNNNGVFGEYADVGSGGIDMMCEVAVGRIPVYDTNTAQIAFLDSILAKTKAYETPTAWTWRTNYLGSASFQDDSFYVDGAEMIEHFCNNVCVSNGMGAVRLYQQGTKDSRCDSVYAGDYELRGAAFGGNTNHHHYHWQNNDYGVVMWWGHGADTWTQVGPNLVPDGILFTNADASGLDDSHPSFLFPTSCNNGYPETTNNLCVSVLRNGVIATLGPSRVTWAVNIKWLLSYFDNCSDNASYTYSAARRMIREEEAIGDAISWVHANGGLSAWQGSALMNHFDFNIYGDPSVGLRTGLNTLTVFSPYGGARPGSVTTNYNSFLTHLITNSPYQPASTMLMVCVRGVVQSNSYTQASSTNVSLSLTNNATLSWQWETNYSLSVMTNGSGNVSIIGGWFRSYSNAFVGAIPSIGWHFAGWSGDTQGDTNSAGMTMLMDRARFITANFAMNQPVIITGHPQSLTNNPGTAASFAVTASGAPAPAYQWRKNALDISSATCATYAIASVAAGDAGGYDCVVSNIVNWAISAAAILTVNAPVVITGEPQSRTNNAGTAASFTVAASGTPPLFYQWQQDGVQLNTATNATHTISAAATSDAGSYQCLVGNMVNTATSAVAILTVNKLSQSIVFDAVPEQRTTNTVALSATANSGLPVSFSVASGPGVVASGVLSFNAAGVVRVVASQPGDAVYHAAAPVTNSVVVKRSAQTITFPAIPEQRTTNTVALSASASSGLPVSFSVASGPGSIASGVLSFSGTGVVKVVASQAGDAKFLAAQPVTNAVTVRKTAQTITFPAIPEHRVNDNVALSATASSGLPVSFSVASGPGSIASGVLSFTDAGEVRVVAGQAGNAAFDPAKPVTNVVTVKDVGSVINDYDGNGISELAVYDNNVGSWYAYSLQTGQATVWGRSWGWPGAETVPGDYDGDAFSDMAVYDQNTGYWYVWSEARGISLVWARPWGWPGAETVYGDYDGDGKSDLAVYDQPSGFWYIITMGDVVLAWDRPWGWTGAITVPGDYNGDGINDLCVYDQNTGYWYVQTLAGKVLAWEQPWGWPGATTVPGDYDGDGKSDMAVYDQPTGAWYVWSQAKGKALIWAEPWGWTGAVPVPGDYDGDEHADLAVFDTITGYWYVWSEVKGVALAWAVNWGWPGATPPGGRQ